ncbi:TPA: LPXTG cell wall anchor domain-containing protein, partial [Streptococcus pyogenes]|nr:LPXTG cell wall anchor domain-containing protein [Streptococcus pyogenes]
SLLCRYGLTSAAALLLTFGGASAVKADVVGRQQVQDELQNQRKALPRLKEFYKDTPNSGVENTPIYKYLTEMEGKLNRYLKTLDEGLHQLQGDKGEPGAQGPAGPMGPAGERGEKGAQGPRGEQGPQGLPGKDGEAGAQGPAGPRGDKGEKGEQGPAGKDGERGPIGPAGKDGQNGKDGLPGKDGKDGQNGKDGLPGKDGKDGQNGKDGLPGKDGKDGQDGKDGLPGKPAPQTPEVPQKPDTAPHTPKTPQIPGQSKDVTPAPQNPSNRGLNKLQTQGGNQLAKTPAAHDTHRQLPATGETTNPFFTAAAVAIMTTAGVVAVAKRQENN